jgi:hypothetical protein
MATRFACVTFIRAFCDSYTLAMLQTVEERKHRPRSFNCLLCRHSSRERRSALFDWLEAADHTPIKEH